MPPSPIGSPRRLFAALAVVLITSLVGMNRVSAYPEPGPAADVGEPATFLPSPHATPFCASPIYFGPHTELQALVAANGNYDVNPTRDEDGDGDPTNDSGVQAVAEFHSETGGGPTLTGTTKTYADYGGYTSPYLSKDLADIGVVVAGGAEVHVALSEPLFYSQWVFTDIDQNAEGFEVTPNWADAATAILITGGDADFDFSNSTPTFIDFNDTDEVEGTGNQLATRVQVDFLGPVSGVELVKTGIGGSGIAVGGGCEAIGVSKQLANVTWDATAQKYTAEYQISVTNNLPTTESIAQVLADATSSAPVAFTTGDTAGISILNLQLSDELDTTGFSRVAVSRLETGAGLTANPDFDGINDTTLLSGDLALPPTTTENITMVVDYFVDLSDSDGECPSLQLDNQVEATGTAAGLTVSDLSDSGTDAGPAGFNSTGGPDDATTVNFPTINCDSLTITKSTTTPAVELTSPTGTVDVRYTIDVTNSSDVDLTTLPTDDLSTAFAGATISNINLTASGACTGLENPDFGPDTPELLTRAVILKADPAETCSVALAFKLSPDPATPLPTTYTNVAEAVAYLTSYDANGDPLTGTSSVTNSATAETAVSERRHTISGSVLSDTDNDDTGDVGLDGVTVTLVDQAGNEVATTTTADDGSYSFADVQGGTYRIVQTDLAGYASVSDGDDVNDNRTEITVSADVADVDFVDEPTAAISGTVAEDTDGDGNPDGSLEGVTIELRDSAGAVIATATTAADGTYTFADVRPGDYTITEVDPDGYASVTDNTINVTTAGAPVDNVDFVDAPPEISSDQSLNNTIGQAVSINLLANDDPVIDPAALSLLDPITGATTDRVIVAGEGTWELDDAGIATFTPESGFEGSPTPIEYQADNASAGVASAQIVVTYAPEAIDDSSVGNTEGATVTVDVLANDVGELDPTSVKIVDPVAGDAVTELTVDGQGVWSVDPATGEISFRPEAGFMANPTPIDYQATNAACDPDTDDPYSLCQPVEAEVTVKYKPEASPDEVDNLMPGTTAVLNPLDNDEGDFDISSVRIVVPGTGEPVTALVVPDEGTWTVDTATGAVTFLPSPSLVGDPTPIEYQVATTDGDIASSTATVTYQAATSTTTTTTTTATSSSTTSTTVSTTLPSTQPPSTQPPTLAFTGSSTSKSFITGLALVLSGIGVLFERRRRFSQ